MSATLSNPEPPTSVPQPDARGRLRLALSGFAIATIAAVCGIGGGLFAVPLLHYAFGLGLPAAVATSLCLVFATAFSSTVTELLHPGGVVAPYVVGALIAGSLVGAQLGHWVAQRITTRPLKALFCVVMLMAGARLIFAAGGADAQQQAAFVTDPAQLLTALGVGLVAGVVVPLLGVGGGLVVVPALLFLIPEIGYLGARAASLAMAVVTSSRAIWLKARTGLVHSGLALPFACGALAGAVLGVQIVHLEGAARAGQVVLGGVLCISGVRFGRDAWRAPSS